MKTIKDRKLDFCIVVSFNKPEQALSYYQQKWQMETLFRELKSGDGFNFEDNTHLIHYDRIARLVMVAFVWCYKIGDHIDAKYAP